MGYLYPPTIAQSTVAAFGTTIKIPYIDNIANTATDFRLKIMSFQNNSIIYDDQPGSKADDENIAIFNIDKLFSKLSVGMYYKIQMAYYKENDTSIYSDIATLKYTEKPSVSISNLNTANPVLMSQPIFIGVFEKDKKDLLENLAFYEFNIYNSNGELYATSGEKSYSVSKNSDKEIIKLKIYEEGAESEEASEIKISVKKQKTELIFSPNLMFPSKKIFSIEFKAKTINGLVLSSGKCLFYCFDGLKVDFDCKLIPMPNLNKGTIDLYIESTSTVTSGIYVISRSSEENNWRTREKIAELNFSIRTNTQIFLYRDYNVKQGINYKYYIQMKNDDNIHSFPIETSKIMADFEDMFLYDGTKQLCIKFNPEVSSFKTVITEQKIETLGNDYPFFFRSGKKGYKEFPISGLISYHMDKTFCSEKELGINEDDKNTNLTGQNVSAERKFREKVEKWLNNGQPKLFRSPTEGNFIVMLSGVELTPNTTVARMLYTFSATVTEVADYNYNNYLKYNFGSIIAQTMYSKNIYDQILNEPTSFYWRGISSFKITNGLPGYVFYLNFGSTKYDSKIANNPNDKELAKNKLVKIQLGKTGSYSLDKIDQLKQIIPGGHTIKAPYLPRCDYIATPNRTSNYFNSVKTLKLSIEIAKEIASGASSKYTFNWFKSRQKDSAETDYIDEGHLLQFFANGKGSPNFTIEYLDGTTNKINIENIGSYEIRGNEQLENIFEITFNNIDAYFTYDKVTVIEN